MQKGDKRKQEILDTAEEQFCRKGYEKTSVQDILDILSLSKGSFYHHFESKEAVLEEICSRNIRERCRKASEKAESQASVIKALNQILSDMMPFSDENKHFLLLILPVIPLQEGRSLLSCYQTVLHESYRKILTDIINKGIQEQLFYCRNSEITADICIDMINVLWYKIILFIQKGKNDKTETDFQTLTELINTYRISIESILYAPYGSVLLLGMKELIALDTNIRNQFNAY